MRPGVLTAMINYYRAYYLGGGLRRQRKVGFKTIEAPTLMLWGEADTALSKESTYGTESWVQDYRVRYLPYVSHWVQQEQRSCKRHDRCLFIGQTYPTVCLELVPT